jgi:hypothetical protein
MTTTVPVHVPGTPSDIDEENEEDVVGPEGTAAFPDPHLGRASPMRYVHGAPLHNVLEEEEEE